MVSWVLLILSIYVVLTGYLLLKRKGKPDRNFENTLLVKSGIYRIYKTSFISFSIPSWHRSYVKDPAPVQLILGCINLIAVYFTARIEEHEMIAKFGEEYKIYMKETKMFIPFIL